MPGNRLVWPFRFHVEVEKPRIGARGLRLSFLGVAAIQSLTRTGEGHLAQSRKQKVLQEVQRKRRQRTITTIAIVAILVAVIIVAIFLIPRPPPNVVQLPPYLDHCVTGSLVYHSHPDLSITISGQAIVIPVTFDSSCAQPIHTHDSSGVLHVETDQNQNYTLGDWFLLWGHFANSQSQTIYNRTQIFNNRVDATHHLTMTVNGVNDTTDYQNLQLPRNAGTSTTCAVAGGCQPFNVVITYG